MQKIAYHSTNTNPEIIKNEGFKLGKGFTQENMFEDLYENYLPEIPVFVTKEKPWDDSAKYLIELDISGLELFPDFGSLVDVGAIYDFDEELFYWEDFSDIPNLSLRQYIENTFGEPILPASEFSGEDSWKYLGSACVSGKHLENRIIDWKILKS